MEFGITEEGAIGSGKQLVDGARAFEEAFVRRSRPIAKKYKTTNSQGTPKSHRQPLAWKRRLVGTQGGLVQASVTWCHLSFNLGMPFSWPIMQQSHKPSLRFRGVWVENSVGQAEMKSANANELAQVGLNLDAEAVSRDVLMAGSSFREGQYLWVLGRSIRASNKFLKKLLCKDWLKKDLDKRNATINGSGFGSRLPDINV
ncbi:hypothetical protein VNO78_11935 [Psophocarpus tetragonolobus]|uniref:Uncharacterized protein n=1 Tax=Psophocarpus tetragonolobus TaxID=3891 RepID=A0AAN9SM82_PSOTE